MSKMSDASVHTILEKDKCKMVSRNNGIVERGVWIGTLHKLLGRTIISGCNGTIVTENIIDRTPIVHVQKIGVSTITGRTIENGYGVG